MALRLRRECEASIVISAPVAAVWEIVSDVTRVGEWSVECRGCEWLDGAMAPVAGARFRGRNRRNTSRWSRTCEVLEVDAPRLFVWRTLPTRAIPDSTRWHFELAEEGDRTRLTLGMQILRIPALHERLFATMFPQHRDRTPDLESDLERIKTAVESLAARA